jgi:hypothetical protein
VDEQEEAQKCGKIIAKVAIFIHAMLLTPRKII